MAKSITKRPAFVPPTLIEVEKYISMQRPEWPNVFVTRIAARFINKYAAADWYYSGRKLKSWPHAIQAYWLEVSHPADRAALDSALKDPSHQLKMQKQKRIDAGLFASHDEQIQVADRLEKLLDRLNEIQKKVIAGEADLKALWTEYDVLKGLKIMRLPKDQMNQIMILKGESNERGKAYCVEYLFRNKNHEGKTIKQFYYEIHNHENDNAAV